ncbi:MAG: universal stress protein [Haloarculaceae archaeon]
MENGLAALVERSEAERELLREAAEVSACTDAPLRVLALVSPEEYESSSESIEITSDIERTVYDRTSVGDDLRTEAEEFVDDALEDDVPVDIMVKVVERSDRADAIMTTAEDVGCDHVFMAGKQRSPTRKAILGDTTQEVLLNYDGIVTLSMGPS